MSHKSFRATKVTLHRTVRACSAVSCVRGVVLSHTRTSRAASVWRAKRCTASESGRALLIAVLQQEGEPSLVMRSPYAAVDIPEHVNVAQWVLAGVEQHGRRAALVESGTGSEITCALRRLLCKLGVGDAPRPRVAGTCSCGPRRSVRRRDCASAGFGRATCSRCACPARWSCPW